MDKLTERMIFVAAGDNSVDQVLFNTAGIYSWTVPPGVTSISAVGVQGGQGGASAGGRGGDLGYLNNIAVTPGEVLTIEVGAGGVGATFVENSNGVRGSLGGHTYLRRGSTTLLATDGAIGHPRQLGGAGGLGTTYSGGGGGGAAGYSGPGGTGTSAGSTSGTAGSGGGGGGGGANSALYTTSSFAFGHAGSRGGGVGLQGQGTNGSPGPNLNDASTPASPAPATSGSPTGDNEAGSGGGGGYQFITTDTGARSPSTGAYGQGGALRIMWPGNLRQFPSTRTLDE